MNNRLGVRLAWVVAAPLLAVAGIASATYAIAVWATGKVLDLDPFDDDNREAAVGAEEAG